MKCPNCGRDNPDIRLFCAHCGELLPEIDESQEKMPHEIASSADADAYQRPQSQKESADTGKTKPTSVLFEQNDTEFYQRRERARRIYEDMWPEENDPESAEKAPPSLFDETDNTAPQKSAYSHAPELGRSKPSAAPRPSTYLPSRDDEFDPDSIFDVHGRAASFDGGESKPRARSRLHRGDEFEDGDRQSFAVRHMRGIVAAALLIFTIAIVVIWAITPAAQLTLAKLDMAWSAAAYEKIGLEAWEKGDYTASGHYFTQAFKRDPKNSAYAVYAANSYIEVGDMDKAADAIRKCIVAEPNNAEYYVALMGIYSGYENLPEADRQLVDEGYRRTGDGRLENNKVED